MRTLSVKDLARLLASGEVNEASFTAQEWVALAGAVPRRDWSRLSENRFAIRVKGGRWRVYEWRKHDPDEDGHVVSIRAVGWL